MAIHVTCPECFRDYSIPDQYAGKKVKCKGCGAAIRVEADPVLEDESFHDEPRSTPSASGLPPRFGAKPAASAARQKPKSGSGSTTLYWVLGILGGGVLAVLLCCGGGALWVRNTVNELEQKAANTKVHEHEPDFGAPQSLFPVASIPVPQFPELGELTPIDGSDVGTYFVALSSIPSNTGSAGMKMSMRVYVPPGEHAAQSLPCVLVAPAGTTLLTGVALDDGDYHDETLPYAEAGMVVIHHSLDGDELDEESAEASANAPYLLFRAACAGVVNTRNALEFARAKLPMVDPNRIYAAGHSSAGTLSLLAAAHEPRLAGAIAYMPATDLKSRMGDIADVPMSGFLFPKVGDFITQSSPDTHLAAIKSPVFLFHAKDDSNVPFADSKKFADALLAQQKDVTFDFVDVGDHYEAMVNDGIPRAIEWLKTRNPR
ncbi:MAG: prolyl oligopeptidase family serine peptidase [Planctomycetota bacterium]|nr:prolyl oligopeptidase family serine peptidase [Planctomycetaceae bacterium]MDQ3331557.1 prolyl oligopeptidase family serine peptidase [Planctomycetota bacterium]